MFLNILLYLGPSSPFALDVVMAAFFMLENFSPEKASSPAGGAGGSPVVAKSPAKVKSPAKAAAKSPAKTTSPGKAPAKSPAKPPLKGRGKDRAQRAERNSQLTFAGRRPPKNAEGARFYFSLKESYAKVKEGNPSSTQTEYWTFMMKQLKGKAKTEVNIAEACKMFMRRHGPGQ